MKYMLEALKKSTFWDLLFYALIVLYSTVAFIQGEVVEGLLWLGILYFAFLNNWGGQIRKEMEKSNKDLIQLSQDLLDINQKTVEHYTGRPVKLEKDEEL